MKYFVTGNEYISLPTIRAIDGALEGITFLHMGAKGLLEMRGSETAPFLQPYVVRDGEELALKDLEWTYESHWIPSYTARLGDVTLHGMLLAPLDERGFCCRLWLEGATQEHRWEMGLRGCWGKTLHSVNESKEILAEKNLYRSNWNHIYCMDIRPNISLFAFAPLLFEDWMQDRYRYEFQKKDGCVSYRLWTSWECDEKPEASEFWFGLGYDEVAAATSAKELFRQSFDHLLGRTKKWLEARARHAVDAALEDKLNRNLFFSYFFGSGKTLDTEEYVLVTSRSPRYYVSAAYWDRDSLLWSFPSILMMDEEIAEQMLRYVFTRQIRNVGVHSRFIDGTVLEPGFELDELCAPILALYRYVQKSGNRDYVRKSFVEEGVEYILKRLRTKRHSAVALYETFLLPTDDMRTYPYITYDNVLVWCALHEIAELYEGVWPEERLRLLIGEVASVREAILKNCVFEKDGRNIFAWSVDLAGNWDIYDEPPGSLLLLPHYGFCEPDDPVWQHTASVIRREDYPYSFAGCPIAEIGCPHAPHPWILSLSNSMLSDRKEAAREHLLRCEMDNGFACESVDEYTGACRTGEAFATCAGFLAYALYEAFGQ